MNKNLKLFPIMDKRRSLPSFFAASSLDESETEDLIKLYEFFLMQEEKKQNSKISEMLKK